MTSSPKFLFSSFDVTRQDVLVLPRRVVPRLEDMTHLEVADLFTSVQTIGKVLEKLYAAQALTVSLQDGVAAGQSVPHVHVHILPRHVTDFEGDNDKIYPALEASEKALESNLKEVKQPSARRVKQGVAEMLSTKSEDRPPRSEAVMEKEAKWLAKAMETAGGFAEESSKGRL